MNTLKLGHRMAITGKSPITPYEMPPQHLLTHGVVVGMTGSGKTGLVTVIVEEALRAGVPVLAIDVKGDLPNLLLAFPSFDAAEMTPWVEPAEGDEDGIADEPLVRDAIDKRRRGLDAGGIRGAELAEFGAKTLVRVITPGSDAGEPLHLLSALERSSSRWDTDIEGARATLGAAVSMVLRLIGRDGDPGKSKEHAMICVLAEARLKRGKTASLEALLPEILEPPMESVGALSVEDFLGFRQRRELAADLNTLIASPSFTTWRQGQDLDVGKWMEPVDGRTTATVISVAHLDDEERTLVLGVILEEALTWVRSLPGTARLRGLIVFDEVYGFIPPHPANPPTKRPMVALMKQARAYGVGCVLATQNPMDLDYRTLSNAGVWALGRLQTDADRTRVMEGLGEDKKKSELAVIVKRLAPRWFVMRDSHEKGLSLLQPRWAISYLRGPMTRSEIQAARGVTPAPAGEACAAAPADEPSGEKTIEPVAPEPMRPLAAVFRG